MEPEIKDTAASGAQAKIDRANSSFWDELCGTQLAKTLGIKDHSPESLKRFDDWYMNFYPYLNEHIPFGIFAGKQVLEIGLGYGTVSQRIAESGAIYSGFDIADGPIVMANRRIANAGATGEAVKGSILHAPFPDAHFDYVVAIGSLHHTGALDQALREVHRLLKQGGGATIMVYNATSYRQWYLAPRKTLARLVSNPATYTSCNETDERVRRAYDADGEGHGAPQTEFVTKAELAHMSRAFSARSMKCENIGADGVFRYLNRETTCRLFGSFLGLDIYCKLLK